MNIRASQATGSSSTAANGPAWGLEVSYTFENLSEGNNTLAVKAVANAGNVNETSVLVTRDSTTPVITITSPTNGLVTGAAT